MTQQYFERIQTGQLTLDPVSSLVSDVYSGDGSDPSDEDYSPDDYTEPPPLTHPEDLAQKSLDTLSDERNVEIIAPDSTEYYDFNLTAQQNYTKDQVECPGPFRSNVTHLSFICQVNLKILSKKLLLIIPDFSVSPS